MSKTKGDAVGGRPLPPLMDWRKWLGAAAAIAMVAVVIVMLAPDAPPKNVQVQSISSTEINISWLPPPEIDQNGIIITYEVKYEPLTTFNGQIATNSVNTTDGLDLQMTLTGLQEYVEYNITVRAYTAVGAGPFSIGVFTTTLQDGPRLPPQNVQATTLSSTAITVTWSAIPEIDQNGIITTYEVQYDPLTTFGGMIGIEHVNTTSGSVFEIVLENLEENVEYNISVRGHTEVGPGPFSGPETSSTFEDEPDAPPQSIQVQSVSSTEIKVSWLPTPEIDQNGIIIMYEVKYEPLTTFNGQIATNYVNTTDGLDLQMTLTGLQEYVEYNITVRAYTAVGAGPFSIGDFTTTLQDEPDAPPQNVAAITSSPTEILVFWEEVAAIKQNGEIILYEIVYTPLDTFGGLIGTNSVNTTNGSVLQITLRDLQEHVEYDIAVRAFTSVGPGPFCPVVSNRTFEDAPAASPQKVQTETLSSIEIHVSWIPPPEIGCNGIITVYEVQYEPLKTFGGLIFTKTTNASIVEIAIRGLEPNVEYKISVRMYTCVGPGPYSLAEYDETFEDEPDAPPQNVQAETLSSTEIKVSWLPPPEIDQNGIIIAYEVKYEPLTTFNGQIATNYVNTTDGLDLQMTLTGLQEYVEYNITVRAYTAVGAGPFSPIISNRTFEDAPAASPQKVQTETLSSIEIHVSWILPPEIDHNGIITVYEVQYEPLKTFGGLIFTKTTNTSIVEIVIRGLEANVEYRICVRMYTNVGPGPCSLAEFDATFEDEPDAPPQNVQAETLSSTEIKVSWLPTPEIDQNGIIITYEVKYEPLTTFNGQIATNSVNTTDGLDLQMTLTGLQEYVEYNITVRAYTAVGAGPFSIGVFTTTLQDGPRLPPQNVQATTLSSTAITVTWSAIPEIDQNGIITTYEVQYDPLTTFGGMIGIEHVNTTNGSVFEIVLQNLEENVEYNISVRGHTEVGPGPFSGPETSRTFENEPDAPPQNVAATTSSPTEICVSCEEVPAIKQNGEITLYEILYTPLNTFGGLIGTNSVNTTNGSVLQTTLRDLQEHVEYDITVRAFTSVGPGPFSPVVSNRTFEDAPAASPQKVQTKTLSSIEIHVSWIPPPEIGCNGIITVYEVQYEPLKTFGGLIFTETTNASIMEIAIRGLEPNVEYKISVRMYTCVGPGPYSLAEYDETFEDEPDAPPQNVQAETLSSTEIKVSWLPPPEIDQNGIIITYEVKYEPLTTFNGQIATNSVNTTDGLDLQMTLTGLQEYVEYNITVRAYTAVGAGPFSIGVFTTTLQDGPRLPPQNVQATTLSSTAITVTWSAIPEIDQNGIITTYEVQYDPLTTFGGMIGVERVNTTSGSAFEIVLQNLEENVEYNISVRGHTEVAPGPFNGPETSRTFEDAPDAPPQNVAATTLSSTEILVSWEEVPAISQNGEITLYEILYTPLNTFGGLIGTNSANTTDGSMVQKRLTGLVGFVEYSISVRAYTGVGPGPYSPAVANRTFQDRPSTPERPSPDLITSTSVTLRWKEPCPPRGIINKYTVNLVVTNLFLEHHKTDIIKPDCVTGGEDGVNRNISVPGDQTSLTVNDLTPFTAYKFQIQAETEVGPGDFSEPQRFTSLEDVPSEPLNLVVHYVSSTALEVTWNPPLCDYGIRMGYTVTHVPLPSSLDPQGVQGMPGSPHNLPADATSLTITQLTPNTNYSVTACAFTSVGCGSVSVVVNQTDEDVPGAISNLEVNSNRNPGGLPNTVTIEITWDGPSRRNGLYGYNLTYSAAQRDPYPESRRQTVSPQTVSLDDGDIKGHFTVNDALPFANYYVSVFAYNLKHGVDTAGPTLRNDLMPFRSVPSTPTAVTNLMAVAASAQSIRVKWGLPLYPNGPILHYIVYYLQQPPIQSNNYASIQVEYPKMEATITDLNPFTNYSIHVLPVGGEPGQSKLSQGAVDEEILQRTNSTVPAEPPHLSEEAQQTQSSSKIFVHLPLPDQIVTGRVIFYAIVVVRGGNPAKNLDQSEYDDAEPYPGRNGFYITAAWAGENISLVSVSFTVGSNSTTIANGVTYCNAELQSNTGYSIFIRIDIESDNDEPLRTYSKYVRATTAPPYSPVAIFIIALLVIWAIVGTNWYYVKDMIQVKALEQSDLDVLVDCLKNAASKWKRIGKALGFLDGNLDNISRMPLPMSGNESFLRELLKLWLWAPPNDQFPTLKALVGVLKTVGENIMACDLPQQFQMLQKAHNAQQQYGQPPVLQNGGSHQQPGHHSPQQGRQLQQQVVPLTGAKVVKICDVLNESGFRSSFWQDLAARLGISNPDSIATQKPNDSLRLQETIRQWLQIDTQPSWVTLSDEVSRIESYGPATKQKILSNAEIRSINLLGQL